MSNQDSIQAIEDVNTSNSSDEEVQETNNTTPIQRSRNRYVNPRATTSSAKRNAASRLFCFTIAKIPVDSVTKDEIFKLLDPYTSQIVIGQEKHENDDDNFHVYYRLEDNIKFPEQMLMDHLEKLLVGIDFTICHQSVKKYQEALQYCTKKDSDPSYKGVDTKHFSQAYHVVNFCRKNKEIDLGSMEYISNKYKTQIKESHSAITAKLTKLIPLQPLILFKPFGNWIDQLIDWLNDWIKNGWEPRKKQLFIWGDANAGKTEILRAIFGK